MPPIVRNNLRKVKGIKREGKFKSEFKSESGPEGRKMEEGEVFCVLADGKVGVVSGVRAGISPICLPLLLFAPKVFAIYLTLAILSFPWLLRTQPQPCPYLTLAILSFP